MDDYIRLYMARDGYRWSLHASNGKIIAESGESYVHKDDALHIIVTRFPTTEIRDEVG
jgi:uncharacterized protein YegP (UPF0339 family)